MNNISIEAMKVFSRLFLGGSFSVFPLFLCGLFSISLCCICPHIIHHGIDTLLASIQFDIPCLTNVCLEILMDEANTLQTLTLKTRAVQSPQVFFDTFLYSLHIRGHFELLKAFLHFYSQFPWFFELFRKNVTVIKHWNLEMMLYFSSLNFNISYYDFKLKLIEEYCIACEGKASLEGRLLYFIYGTLAQN